MPLNKTRGGPQEALVRQHFRLDDIQNPPATPAGPVSSLAQIGNGGFLDSGFSYHYDYANGQSWAGKQWDLLMHVWPSGSSGTLLEAIPVHSGYPVQVYLIELCAGSFGAMTVKFYLNGTLADTLILGSIAGGFGYAYARYDTVASRSIWPTTANAPGVPDIFQVECSSGGGCAGFAENVTAWVHAI